MPADAVPAELRLAALSDIFVKKFLHSILKALEVLISRLTRASKSALSLRTSEVGSGVACCAEGCAL